MRKYLILYIFFNVITGALLAQTVSEEAIDKTTVTGDSVAGLSDAGTPVNSTVNEKPVISYTATPKEYTIQEIIVTGAGNYDKDVIIGYSGLKAGERVKMPGDAFSNAIKRFWRQGLFSDVKINATKVQGDKVWLEIALQPRPRISEINIFGVKKKDKEDLETGLGLIKGSQISPNMVNRAEIVIKRKLEAKGYEKAEVDFIQRDDPGNPGFVIVDINIDKKDKIKVRNIFIEGNKELSDNQVKKAMKKTKDKRLMTLFKSKKFIREEYENDKKLIIDKYNEKGFRDAELLSDSVVPDPDKENKVNIYITVDEGQKYYFRNISWVGNTIYPGDVLSSVLGIKKGDVYNQKLLNERLLMDEDAVSGLYLDNGYLFFNVDPVEINIEGDSIDLEMRIYEGKQATIDKVIINGNTAVHENVIRRELRTKPGQLFSKSDLQRSARELAQTGHFDPEKLDIRPEPDPEDGTVDIIYNLEQKRNDQVELSFGWGQTGIIGSVGLKFTNFSIQNIFNKESYRPLPQGDGQQFGISFQTNAQYYTAASVSFMEPWLGGNKPTSLSSSLYWSRQTGISNYYYSDSYNYNYLAGNNGYDYSYIYEADPDKHIVTLGGAIGLGRRLSWPDDYFSIYGEVAYRHYNLKNWEYFDLQTGKANNLSFGITWSRNSTDNPFFTRTGSMFSLLLQATPPYSLFKDNSRVNALVNKFKDRHPRDLTPGEHEEYLEMQQELFRWVEYYKTEFKARLFTPLSPDQKLVLMTRAEYGFLGYYNKNRRSPFERYYMGGDGMSGASSTYATSTVSLRGYKNGSITPYDLVSGRQNGNMYTKLSLELRYPLMLQPMSTIYILAFADAGNAWSEFHQFNPFDLKRSAGAGVRVFLPMIGLIGVDYGYGFDYARDGERGGSNFHLVIGQEF
ncbi:MAG: BamA/TamA family outer membrane protein [Prevotellaceae bacterium]|jgi:outer membrane protein insertion porin family|nr:BamA/TamA family outer membrane protein [Prevotellaceae bacterium]